MKLITTQREATSWQPKTRFAEREARRAASVEVARKAAEARSVRSSQVSIKNEVEKAALRIAGRNAAGVLQEIEAAAPLQRDYFLLAEEYGKARTTILRQFPAVSKSLKDRYLQEAGLRPVPTAPDESPESGEQPEE